MSLQTERPTIAANGRPNNREFSRKDSSESTPTVANNLQPLDCTDPERPCDHVVTARQSIFWSISESLLIYRLWCFPLHFKPSPDFKRFDKIPLVKWKPFQNRPPTQTERDEWHQKFIRAKGAGMPTGPAIGIVVVDADSADAIEWLELRDMPDTWLVRTRRGLQYYYRYPLDIDVRNSAGAIAPGVDVRGIGGMVAAPGSQYSFIDDSDSGPPQFKSFTYQWEPGHSPADLPLADSPVWLLDWLHKEAERATPATPPAPARPYCGRVRAWARKAYDAELDLLRCAEPGSRNQTCCRTAFRLGQLCSGGELDSAEVLAALHAIANAWPNAAHTIDTMNRAFGAGQAHPRRGPEQRRSRLTVTTITFDLDAPLGSEPITLYNEPLGGAAA